MNNNGLSVYLSLYMQSFLLSINLYIFSSIYISFLTLDDVDMLVI